VTPSRRSSGTAASTGLTIASAMSSSPVMNRIAAPVSSPARLMKSARSATWSAAGVQV
jgi:hypothetical protein